MYRMSAIVLLLVTGWTSHAEGPGFEIKVDPRVEFMSIVFHLAGNPEYRGSRVPAYQQAIDTHFRDYRGHELIQLAAGFSKNTIRK